MSKKQSNKTFLGLKSYTEKDANRFKGRSKESQDLYRLITLNEYTICYAESGEGKTSLLNAGVFPLLRKNRYFPIPIIFTKDDYKRIPRDFDKIIIKCINKYIKKFNKDNPEMDIQYGWYSDDIEMLEQNELLKTVFQTDSWWVFRNFRILFYGLALTPVFVFDQFEEVFNRPQSVVWTKRFFDWLQKISTDSYPDGLIKKIRSIIGESAPFPNLKKTKDFKMIFSLRKEFMAELDYWSMQQYFIPAMKDSRYYLKALSYEGAKSVMQQQRRFEEETIDKVLKHLIKKYVKEDERIVEERLPVVPALLLSVICDNLDGGYNKYSSLIKKDVAACVEKILSLFYENSIKSVLEDLEQQKIEADRKELEEAIFMLVDINGNRERKKITSVELQKVHFNEKYKKVLHKHRLIKIDGNLEEDYVEIVHDSLCPIISERKEKIRKEKEHIKGLISKAKILSAGGKQLINSGDLYLAQLLALRILPTPNQRSFPYTVESENFLREALRNDNTIIGRHTYLAFYTAYSYDGNRFLSTSFDQTICVWDPNNGCLLKTLRPLAGGKGLIRHASFNSDATLIVSASDDGFVRIWEVDRESLIQEHSFSSEVRFATFINKDRNILSITLSGEIYIGSSNDNWNSIKYECKGTLPIIVQSASISPDERLIATASPDNIPRIWSIMKCELFKEFRENGHKEKVRYVSFHPNGFFLISSSDDKTVRVWNVATAKCEKILKGHSDKVFCASFSPDGRYIVSASADQRIVVWDVLNKYRKRELEGHSNYVRYVAYHPNNCQIASASDDKTIRVWDNPFTSEVGYAIAADSRFLENAFFSPDGMYIWAYTQNKIYKGEFYQGRLSPMTEISIYLPDKWSLDEKGNIIYMDSYNDCFYIKNIMVSGSPINIPIDIREPFEELDREEYLFKRSFNNRYVVYVSYVQTWDITVSAKPKQVVVVQIWDITVSTKPKRLKEWKEENPVSEVSFSHDNKYIVLASDVIYIRDLMGNLIGSPHEGYFGKKSKVSFSHNDNMIVYVLNDCTICIWNRVTDDLQVMREEHKGNVNTVSFSTDDSKIVSASSDGTIKIWDVKTGLLIDTIKKERDDKDGFNSAYFCLDNSHIISTSSKGIRLWPFSPLQKLIDETYERFKDRELTPEEKRKYYIE